MLLDRISQMFKSPPLPEIQTTLASRSRVAPTPALPPHITPSERPIIGIWSEIPPDGRWTNEGISRIIGFSIEGSARFGLCKFEIMVRTGIGESVREDLRHLQAQEHIDWEVHEAPADFAPQLSDEEQHIVARFRIKQPCAYQAIWANRNLAIDGWIITFPNFTGAALLNGRRATLLPDAIPYDFPLGWEGESHWGAKGEWVVWQALARLEFQETDAIIAHSEHVADRHGIKLLDCYPDKMHVNLHAPPDLIHLVPEMDERKRTQRSHQRAANRLREHAEAAGLHYLRNFPFEETPLIVVSTQDRPTKNINRAAEAVVKFLREDFRDLKLITTAGLHFGAEWTRLPELISSQRLHFDVVSMRDLSREVHAALYHCASVTVHPSYYEGIVGTLSFYESVSLGTPCILARGPHVDELLALHPELERWVFDPYDLRALSACLNDALDNREEVLAVQQAAFASMSKRSWAVAAQTYIEIALGRKLDQGKSSQIMIAHSPLPEASAGQSS